MRNGATAWPPITPDRRPGRLDPTSAAVVDLGTADFAERLAALLEVPDLDLVFAVGSGLGDGRQLSGRFPLACA